MSSDESHRGHKLVLDSFVADGVPALDTSGGGSGVVMGPRAIDILEEWWMTRGPG